MATGITDRRATVSNRAALRTGSRPTVRIAKTRRTARVGGRCLCVDDLEGGGRFLEVEQMVPRW